MIHNLWGIGNDDPKKGNKKKHPNKQTKCWLVNLGAVDNWKLNGNPQQAVGKLFYKQPFFRFCEDFFSAGLVTCVFFVMLEVDAMCFLSGGLEPPMHIYVYFIP